MWKWIIIIPVVLILAYVGLSLWSGGCEQPREDKLDMPGSEKATHSFFIQNTGGLILSSDYEQHGVSPGSRIFVLQGYWEMRGSKFKFVPGDIILDESVFGEITVQRRSVE